MTKPKIICFDIDGTLIEGNSWLHITEGLGCPVEIHAKLYTDTISNEITFETGERKLIEIWRKSRRATKETFTHIYDNIKIRDGVAELFDFLREQEYLIYLVSGSNKFFAETVAKRLKADDFYSNTEIFFDDEGIVCKIDQKIHEQGQTKVAQVTEIAQNNNTTIRDIYFVGDGNNDIEVFIATGKGLSVHTDNEKLKKVALKNLKNLEELRKFII
jgi:HAD superfamily phosphoserine phosphatase-like hydrolase